MQDSKENQFGNFSKMLRRLEMDNVGLPELRQLKQEHTYLQKLRQQRTKIEELKAKYDATQSELQAYIQENSSQRQLIEEQHRTIQLLQDKLAQSEKKRSQAELGVMRTLEGQREKQRQKVNDLVSEIQQLRRECKSKDLHIFEMEDQIQTAKTQFRDQYLVQRKKLIVQWQEKLKLSFAQTSTREKQNEELRELITRQHKALQLQNQQYQQVSKRNDQLSDTLADLQEQLAQAIRQRAESDQRVSDLTELAARMESQLQDRRNGASAKQQIEQLRKKLGELAKDELQKIEFIVNDD